MRVSSKAVSVSCMSKLVDVADPGVAASAWARRDFMLVKAEGEGEGWRLAGLRPQDREVCELVLGFYGYFLWQ